MGDVYNRRRQEPMARRTLRNAVPQQPQEDSPESIMNLTRKDSPEYRDYLKQGSKASGRMTATQTGAKKMADMLGIEQMTRARRMELRKQRAAKAADRGRMT